MAAGYALASIPGIFPFLAFIVLRQTLQAMGRVAPIVVTIVLANVVNLFFNWVLIYGKLGSPAMGAVGSGWASSLSRWLMFLGMLVFAWPLLRGYLTTAPARGFPAASVGEDGAAGRSHRGPIRSGIRSVRDHRVLMGWMGTVAMAGHQVAMNLASLTFMVPVGNLPGRGCAGGAGGGPGRSLRSSEGRRGRPAHGRWIHGSGRRPLLVGTGAACPGVQR